MNTEWKRSITAMTIVLTLSAGALAAPADFPMQPGEMAGTCFSGPFDAGPNVPLDTAGYVIGVMDVREPPVGSNPVPTPGATWPVNMFHNEFAPTTPQDIWNARNLGQIFGTAIDDANPPNIYVTATTAYGDFTDAVFAHPAGGFGPAGYAGVYRLDGVTGDITPLTLTVPVGSGGAGTNQIPNSGPALGNICFDAAHQQLFVSNFEDGRIYRLDMNGFILSVHDPFAPDTNTPDFARLGERVWAVQRHGDRLYYSVWLRDGGRPTFPWNPAAGPAPANPNNAIFSIAIDPGTGDFAGTDDLEIVLPYLSPGSTYSNPVADIAFSESGAMIVAERTMNGDFGIIDLGHSARVLEYTYSGSWGPSSNEYQIGSTFNASANMYANSSGGTDYDCRSNVWSSGDTLLFGPTVYGWQRVPAGGNTLATPTSTSYFIDPGLFKAGIGDVEVYRACGTLDACTVDPDGQSCLGECASDEENCHPTEILTDADGNFLEITCCDCKYTTCHVDIDPASQEVFCRKLANCPTPPGGHCSPVRQGNPDGTITYYCTCISPEIPPKECQAGEASSPNCPGESTERCLGVCPNADEACLPTTIVESFPGAGDLSVSECECNPVTTDLCRPIINADNRVECIGCDDPDLECELVVSTSPDGAGQEYRCDPCRPTAEIGACCYTDAAGNITCTETTQAECERTLMGDYLGDGTNCTTHGYLCEETMEDPGACCYQEQGTNVCAVVLESECEDVLGGTWLGAGVPCDPDPCPPSDPDGACCYEDIAGGVHCATTTELECEKVYAGIWQGANTDCDPNPCTQEEGCDCQGNCDDSTPAYPDASYAPFTDEVAVATEYSWFGTDPVLVNIDVKNRNTAPINLNWTPRTNTRYSHPSWIRDNLGTIFGVALDSRGHTYVTASTAFATDHEGLGAGGSWGTVYKINASTAAISVFANLPNGGPALGNICYDGPNDQFFVTNHEDGRIYRLDASGACLSTFDHATGTISASCAAETGDGPGYVPLGERLWGVQAYDERLYYGVWSEDYGRPSTTTTNTIWSIPLSGGDFSGSAVQEIAMPPHPSTDYTQPPADISFSETGCMLIAERGMFNDSSPSAHNARVLEYRQTLSGAWVPSPYTFGIGEISFGSDNAAGGVDYDREGNVWATGDALQFYPQTIYGLTSLPCTGGLVTDSVLIDLNGVYSTSDKTDIGDVEIACAEKCITPPRRMTAWFPLDEPDGTVAEEIVWDNDGIYNGTTPIAGMVAGARRFNGTSDFVRVPNGALINFGPFDFSIDAWIRTRVDTGLQVFIEKRAQPTRGYSVFTYNGELGFQLGDGAGYTNWVRPGFIADGEWHHVAVTVDRDNPNGLVLYVDGVGTAYNPTAYSGSTTTNSPLWFGVRDPAFGQIFYEGDLDEIELFRRALRPQEVQALFNAGRQGKCKDRCHLPWDAQLCRNRNTVTVDLTICNDSSVSHDYAWSLAGNNNCSIPGPTVFSPAVGVTTVPAGTCVQVPITITRPAGMVAPQVACYNVTISNLDTGHTFGCEGSIWARNKWCLIIVDVIDVPISLPIGPRPRPIGVLVQNDADEQGLFEYSLEVMSSDMDPDAPDVVSLDGLPPGEPVTGSVQVPLGGERVIEVQARFTEHAPMGFYDLLVMSPTGTDDGVAVPALSVALESVLPCGDLDRSGAIDAGDVPLFESCLAGPDASSACPAPLDADCDDDGDVDLGDFAEIQQVFDTVYYAP